MKMNKISQCTMDSVPLIIGGKKAKPQEFPHMVCVHVPLPVSFLKLQFISFPFYLQVAIGYGENIESLLWLCGGSLISENFVLSAAHCSKSGNRYKQTNKQTTHFLSSDNNSNGKTKSFSEVSPRLSKWESQI